MVSHHPHRSPASHAQFASAGEAWGDSLEAEKDEAKERLKSLRYEKYEFIPIPEHALTWEIRVIEKLKGEGWAEELEQHPSAYAALREIAGVRVAKTLTDRGTWLVALPRHLLITGQPGRDSSVQSSVGWVTRRHRGSNVRQGT